MFQNRDLLEEIVDKGGLFSNALHHDRETAVGAVQHLVLLDGVVIESAAFQFLL